MRNNIINAWMRLRRFMIQLFQYQIEWNRNVLNLLTLEGDFHFHNDYIWNTNVGKCMHFLSHIKTYFAWKYKKCWLCYSYNLCSYVICFIIKHIIHYQLFLSLFINISRKTLKAIVHLNHLHQRHHVHGLFRA